MCKRPAAALLMQGLRGYTVGMNAADAESRNMNTGPRPLEGRVRNSNVVVVVSVEVVGAVFLGVVAILLLRALLRSQEQQRRLLQAAQGRDD